MKTKKFNSLSSRRCPECGEKMEIFVEEIDQKKIVEKVRIVECPICGYESTISRDRKLKPQPIED